MIYDASASHIHGKLCGDNTIRAEDWPVNKQVYKLSRVYAGAPRGPTPGANNYPGPLTPTVGFVAVLSSSGTYQVDKQCRKNVLRSGVGLRKCGGKNCPSRPR